MLVAILPFNLAICLFLITLLVSTLHTRKKNIYIKDISNFLLLSLVFNFTLIFVRITSFIFDSTENVDLPFSSKLFIFNAILYFGSRASLAIFFKNVRQKFTPLETKRFILIIICLQFFFFFLSFLSVDINYILILAACFHFIGCYWEFHELYILQKSHKNSFINLSCLVVFLKTITLFFVLIYLLISTFKHDSILLNLSLATTPFYMFKGTLITFDLIIFVFINAFLFEQVNELSRRTSDENALIKNLLIQQTSLTEAVQNSNKIIVSGALSDSIAHELSHPLASIQANTEILSMQLTSRHLLSGDVQNSVTNILRDTQRAGQTLKALKSLFSVKKELFELNINEVIRLSIDLVSSTINKNNIKLSLQLEKEIPSIMANPHELQQVLLNLLNNSMQAIQKNNPNNGEITISTLIEDESIILSILDNGHGFSIDQEDKIFELLRTTKKEGMGFGLWLSKFILEKNFGNIELLNSPGVGAKLMIKLPIYTPPQSGDNTSYYKLS